MSLVRVLCLVMVLQGLAWARHATQEGPGKIWAVLVAGSNGYYNYRHQADICHAYQIFHRHGIPDSQIIVMMYDDIANNPQNRKKGKIFNKPNGPNVYDGVPKDYTKSEVTPENFIHVITGNSTGVRGVGSEKVLRSGPQDHVFINFVDHGAAGMVGFPGGRRLYKTNLTEALLSMHRSRMFKKLVFYMEACESGSMFSNTLPEDISIIAATAANEYESSYACYFDSMLQTYLGDEFSVAWMEDVDSAEHQVNQTTETIQQQYNDILKRVLQSHPKLYGEMDIEEDHVKDFIGASDNTTETGRTYCDSGRKPFEGSVSSRDVPLHVLTKKMEMTNDIYLISKLRKVRDNLIKGRRTVDSIFQRVLTSASLLTGRDRMDLERSRPEMTWDVMPCYQTLVESFSQDCVDVGKNPYVFGHLYKLANLCSVDKLATQDVLNIYAKECPVDVRGLAGVE